MLKLILIRRGDPSETPIAERVFHGGALTLGRGVECDWVLEDPTRYVSKLHCEFFNRGDDIFISDQSTNGVFLNNAPTRLPLSEAVPINDGDQLTFGEYILKVRREQDFGGAPEPRFNESTLSSELGNQPTTDFPGIGAGITERAAPNAIDDIIGGIGHAPIPADTFNQPDHSYEGRGEISRPIDAPRVADHALPSSNQFAIPEDWGAFGDELAARAVEEPSPLPPVTGPDDLIPPDFALDGEPSAPAPPSIVEPDVDDATATVPTPATIPSDQLPQTSTGGDSFEAFLAGAGLDRAAFEGQDPNQIMEAAGRAYRQAVLNYADILRDRSFLKNEFRLERTMLEQHDNNPLKFSDPQFAAVRLLKPPEPGFLDGAAAIRAAGEDIKKHQFAVLAGLRVAVEALLKRLEPAGILRAVENAKSGRGLIGGGRHRQAWDKFEELHRFCEGEASSTSGGFVNQAFRDGYERQMDQLKNS
ncbi:MAG: type VI secretion system-associated FHA domain protein TagH [Pseudomonadota bacterium]